MSQIFQMYDRATGLHCGSFTDQFDSMVERAGFTLRPLPYVAPTGRVWRWVGGDWLLVSDLRGSYTMEDGTVVSVMDADTPAPAGATASPAARILEGSAGAHEIVPGVVTQSSLLASLASIRYAAEVAGCVAADGTAVLTGRDDQAMTLSAYTTLKEGFSQQIQWKSPSGWRLATLADLEPIARACAQHVQRCFSAESVVAQQITSLTAEVLGSFDVAAAFAEAMQ